MAATGPEQPDEMSPEEKGMEERLERLEEGIEAARRQAEEHGTITESEPEPTFFDPNPEEHGDEQPGTDTA